jgi:hypothetical protein
VALCLNAAGGIGRIDAESETLIPIGGAFDLAHSLRADGFDASEDGTGRGTPIVPIDLRQTSRGDKLTNNRAHGSGGAPGHGVGAAGDPAFTVSERGQAIAFDTTQITHPENRSNPKPDGPSPSLAKGAHPPAIAFSVKDHGAGEIAPTLRAGGHDSSHANGGCMPAVAFNWQSGGDARGLKAQAQAQALSRSQTPAMQCGMQVRRLTPRECERLQGFSDRIKTCRIEVCGDQQKSRARADNPSLRSPSAAGSVAAKQSTETALSVEPPLHVSHHRTSKPAAVSVEIDSEAGTMRLAIPASGWFALVRIADESARTFLATPSGDFARLIVATLSSRERTAHPGKAGAPQSSKHSSPLENGNLAVVLSGQEIADAAENAESVMAAAIQCFTFTTSEVGSSFQNCDWSLQTLCSCVVRAIGSFIPAEIPLGDSFSIELTHRTPYTLIPYRGKPAADGPRYKALGNSMAVPVVRWIGERIQLVERLSSRHA